MQLNCYLKNEHSLIDACAFAVFKAEAKYVVAQTESGTEYLLPERMSLKSLLSAVPGLMRINRSLVVARRYVEGVTGLRDNRRVQVLGQQYALSRDERPEAFRLAAIENSKCQRISWARRKWDMGRQHLEHCLSTVSENPFAMFMVEDGFVIGITESGEEWELPNPKVKICELLQSVHGMMLVNRSVVIGRQFVEAVTGDGRHCKVHALGRVFGLSWILEAEPFRLAAIENTKTKTPRWFPILGIERSIGREAKGVRIPA
jgi:hypothetical protein